MTPRAEGTKKRILEAAELEFAEKGLCGARVDEIAVRAAANKSRHTDGVMRRAEGSLGNEVALQSSGYRMYFRSFYCLVKSHIRES